jgi:hypothetical protein
MLHTFECLYFPNLHDYSPHKLSPKSAPCVFLGYSTLHKGFQCFDRQTRYVYVFHHVNFFETIFSHIDGLVFNIPSTNDYNIFSECAKYVSSPSCLPYSDSPDQSLLVFAASPTQQISLFVPSSATIASTSPEFSQSSLLTNRHPMVTKGKTGVFKPRLQHIMTIGSSS